MIDSIVSENLRLIKIQKSDLECYFQAIKSSYNVLSPWLNWLSVEFCEEDLENLIEVHLNNWDENLEYCYKITNSSNQFLGTINLHVYDFNNQVASVGYWVISEASNKGIASESLRALVEAAFQWLKLNRIEALIATKNIASQKVAIKAGALYECLLKHRLRSKQSFTDAKLYVFFS